MFDYWLHRKWLTELKMMRLFERPNFNPMRYRWFFFPLTAALTVAGLLLFLHRGEKVLNVDFRGGTVFAARLKPGEERGLTTTEGQLGFRELLGEDEQKKRLAVKPGLDSVLWENRPVGDDKDPGWWDRVLSLNSFDYTVTYADGSQATVTLTEKPEGATEAEMREDVRQRAALLPDVSVEQTFLSGEEYPQGKSRLFTVRTTEKQVALVRVALERLMRSDDNKTLLDGATMSYPTKPDEKEKKAVPDFKDGRLALTFDKPTSRAFTQELLTREFKKVLADAGDNVFALTPAGAEVDGRVKEMVLTVGISPDRPISPLALAEVLANTKRAFDATPEPERLDVFDSTLAQETRDKALLAIVVSWVAIILYLWFRFGNWTFGLASVICLGHDLCFTLGAIAVCHYLHLIPGLGFLGLEDFKIDLAAVAALLTLVGYSVNEIIVNFARLREVRGKNPQLTPQMINDGVNQTLSRTVLTSMTVLLVSVVLYAFGGEGVHLFAFVMMMGVLISTYSSIFVASPLLLFLGEGHDAAVAAEEQAEAEREAGTEEEVVEG
jgi:SecD/SecF fusion protein